MDDYYVNNPHVKPVPPALQAYGGLPFMQYNQNAQSDCLSGEYDTRDDEIRSFRVQRALQQNNLLSPGPANLPTNPGNTQFVQTPPGGLPAGMDISQFVSLIDYIRTQDGDGRAAEQLVQTRSGNRSDPASKSNF